MRKSVKKKSLTQQVVTESAKKREAILDAVRKALNSGVPDYDDDASSTISSGSDS